MTNMVVSKQIRIFQSLGYQNSRTKALNYQVQFVKLNLLNVNFDKIFFKGPIRNFPVQKIRNLSALFTCFLKMPQWMSVLQKNSSLHLMMR